MSTLIDTVQSARFDEGFIVISLESGAELRFPVVENPRLASGTPAQLNHIDVSPFGLHWPELDEDLSLRGIVEGRHGQQGMATQPAAEPRPRVVWDCAYRRSFVEIIPAESRRYKSPGSSINITPGSQITQASRLSPPAAFPDLAPTLTLSLVGFCLIPVLPFP